MVRITDHQEILRSRSKLRRIDRARKRGRGKNRDEKDRKRKREKRSGGTGVDGGGGREDREGERKEIDAKRIPLERSGEEDPKDRLS